MMVAIALVIIISAYSFTSRYNTTAKSAQQPKPSSQVIAQIKTSDTDSLPSQLGHFPYAEANTSQLIIIASYAQNEYQRFERLAPEAALALMKLIYAARDDGVWIVPVSGFRDLASQDKLFKKQIEKRGSVAEAAKLSAPPGYSEHHTGYALDLSDGNIPKKDITYELVNTPAFQWLIRRGKDFGFEMSFPENNPQGVSYEPWHWRFIGSPAAIKIFKRAKS